MMIKGIIFDIDGTLADSLGVWTESDRILLSRRGITYSEEVSLALKSMHFMSAAEYLKELYDMPESAEEIACEITEIVRDKYFHEVKLMPFVHELMDMCERKGIKMCAATSNNRELAEGVLERNGILHRLEFILTSDEVGSGKEDPRIFFVCAERLGLSPKEIAVIEDSPHAARTAHNNGFYTIGTDNGHFGDFEELKNCTDLRIGSFEELIKDGFLQ